MCLTTTAQLKLQLSPIWSNLSPYFHAFDTYISSVGCVRVFQRASMLQWPMGTVSVLRGIPWWISSNWSMRPSFRKVQAFLHVSKWLSLPLMVLSVTMPPTHQGELGKGTKRAERFNANQKSYLKALTKAWVTRRKLKPNSVAGSDFSLQRKFFLPNKFCLSFHVWQGNCDSKCR